MDGYYKGRRVLEYRTMGDFAKGQNFVQHLLPHAWAGTGHVVYNGSLYYNKHQSNILVGAGLGRKRGRNKRMINTRCVSPGAVSLPLTQRATSKESERRRVQQHVSLQLGWLLWHRPHGWWDGTLGCVYLHSKCWKHYGTTFLHAHDNITPTTREEKARKGLMWLLTKS